MKPTKEQAFFEATYELCKMSYSQVGITKLTDELLKVFLDNLKNMSETEQGTLGMFVLGYYTALTGDSDTPDPSDEELLQGVLSIYEQRN